MKVAVGSDHRGVEYKRRVMDIIKSQGHDVRDMGAFGPESVDYPDYAQKVADAVLTKECDRGILICGTGIGMCIAANKVKGIRAALCHNRFTAERSRQHNDANILCIGAEVVRDADLPGIIEVWLNTEFEGGRHAKRLEKME
jgi:ribose 5-phosphate isomerase B